MGCREAPSSTHIRNAGERRTPGRRHTKTRGESCEKRPPLKPARAGSIDPADAYHPRDNHPHTARMSADATMADATLDVSTMRHNGCPDPFELVEPFGFARADLVRLMMQCLSSLGYEHAVKSLQQESGIHLFSEPIARFRDCVLCGDWDAAKSVVDHLGFSTLATKLAVQFMLGRQKYLELLEAQRTDAAPCSDELAP